MKINEKRLSLSRLYELLSYDEMTGIFIWLVRRNGFVKAGDIAGKITSTGAQQINIDRSPYLAHRLAWFYMTGKWPPEEVDHRDFNPSNNRWSNLRLARDSQNVFYRRCQRNNTSGYTGVYYNGKRWGARVGYQKREIFVGYFDTIEEAVTARRALTKQLFGEFYVEN